MRKRVKIVEVFLFIFGGRKDGKVWDLICFSLLLVILLQSLCQHFRYFESTIFFKFFGSIGKLLSKFAVEIRPWFASSSARSLPTIPV